MKVQYSKRITGLTVVATVLTFVAGVSIADAATKTISCYKGSVVKKVTTAKCPTGYTTKAPKAVPTKTSPTPVKSTAPAASNSTVAINATYKGTMKVLFSGDDQTREVAVTNISATGTGTTSGLVTMKGSASGTATSESCADATGSGTISGGSDSLNLKFGAGASVCTASGGYALTGTATVNGGTGKYVGATGTLTVKGSFNVKSTDPGASENPGFTMTLTGNITTK